MSVAVELFETARRMEKAWRPAASALAAPETPGLVTELTA